MGATVHQFSSVNLAEMEGQKLYVDTDFLIDLHVDARQVKTPNNKKNIKALAAKAFYDQAIRNNVSFLTTNLAILEFLYVRFDKSLYKEITKLAESEGWRSCDPRTFLKSTPVKFQEIHAQHHDELRRLYLFLVNLKIAAAYPVAALFSGNISGICCYATKLMIKYSMFSADALHVSFARHLGIRNFVSSDKGFQQIDGLTVFCFNPAE